MSLSPEKRSVLSIALCKCSVLFVLLCPQGENDDEDSSDEEAYEPSGSEEEVGSNDSDDSDDYSEESEESESDYSGKGRVGGSLSK